MDYLKIGTLVLAAILGSSVGLQSLETPQVKKQAKRARETPVRSIATLFDGVTLSPQEDLARFEGPYQTSPQTKEPDKLRLRLYTTLPMLSSDVCNIIASYSFYRMQKAITIHKEEFVETIIKKPISYSFLLAHANASIIQGYEIINSLERQSGIPKNLFNLQEWAYKKENGDEDRYSEGHDVTELSRYNITGFDRYTFGISIDPENEWAVRDKLSACPRTASCLSPATRAKVSNRKFMPGRLSIMPINIT